jgi:hypothetical protein
MKSAIPIHRLFLISTYVTVSLATFGLGYVEQEQLRGMSVFYGVMGLLFVVAYLTEDRWKLTDRAANFAALPLLAGWLLWVWVNHAGDTVSDDPTDYLRMLIPHGGPLLALLTLAKLLREKNVRDHWWLQLLALFQMVMACCLAFMSRMDRDDPVFGIFFVGYILSAIWAINLFYLQRESAASEGVSRMRSFVIPTNERSSRPQESGGHREPLPPVVPWRLYGVPSGLAWFALASLFSLTVFFGFSQANPDGSASLVLPGQTKAQAGFNTSMDLNQNIPLTVTDALVMRVQAHDALGNAVNLGQNQRWRGITCSQYERGRWSGRPPQDVGMMEDFHLRPEGRQLLLTYYVDLAALGPGQHMGSLEELPHGVTGARPLFLAEPIYFPTPARGEYTPGRVETPRVALVNPPVWMKQTLGFRRDEPVLTLRMGRVTGTLRYQQLHLIPEGLDREYGQPMRLSASYVTSLLSTPRTELGGGRLKAMAEGILTKANLPTGEGLRRAAIDGKLNEEQERQLRINQARTLQDYLLNAPDYNYALEHHRVDGELDPTIDFLLNGKQGHCQLFASALALMLRSQGIPSRIVIGFRGSEWLSAGEIHEVRQYHSHAWVEAFIDVRDPVGRFERRGRWLMLDSTPGGGTETIFHETSNDQGGAFQDEIHLARYLWEALILDYSGDLRPHTILGGLLPKIDWSSWSMTDDAGAPTGAWSGRVILTIVGFGILALALTLWVRRRLAAARRVAAQAALTVPFYRRWLRLMARLNLRPKLSQTPAEFSAVASSRLRRQPAIAALAHLPAVLVEIFYAIRYGGKTPDAAQVTALERDLDRLEQTL